VKITGQNGKTANQNPKIQTSCGGSARHKRHHDRTSGGRR
jgi:hypothetical protein